MKTTYMIFFGLILSFVVTIAMISVYAIKA